jgi:hypothetical protein
MIRRENWVILLDEYLQWKETVPFVFGANDCCLFAAGAVQAITGIDLAVAFRGKYKTEATAIRALKRYAGGGVRELMERMASENSLLETSPLSLSRGSVALIQHEGRDSLGIISLTGMHIVAPGIAGTVHLPLNRAITGWLI